MKNENINLIYIEESLGMSIIKDVITFGFLLLCIYVSRDSNWWTFFSGCMSLGFIAGLAVKQSNHSKRFKTFEDMKEWVNSQ